MGVKKRVTKIETSLQAAQIFRKVDELFSAAINSGSSSSAVFADAVTQLFSNYLVAGFKYTLTDISGVVHVVIGHDQTVALLAHLTDGVYSFRETLPPSLNVESYSNDHSGLTLTSSAVVIHNFTLRADAPAVIAYGDYGNHTALFASPDGEAEDLRMVEATLTIFKVLVF